MRGRKVRETGKGEAEDGNDGGKLRGRERSRDGMGEVEVRGEKGRGIDGAKLKRRGRCRPCSDAYIHIVAGSWCYGYETGYFANGASQ